MHTHKSTETCLKSWYATVYSYTVHSGSACKDKGSSTASIKNISELLSVTVPSLQTEILFYYMYDIHYNCVDRSHFLSSHSVCTRYSIIFSLKVKPNHQPLLIQVVYLTAKTNILLSAIKKYLAVMQ